MTHLTSKFILAINFIHVFQICLYFTYWITNTNSTNSIFISNRACKAKNLCHMLTQKIPVFYFRRWKFKFIFKRLAIPFSIPGFTFQQFRCFFYRNSKSSLKLNFKILLSFFFWNTIIIFHYIFQLIYFIFYKSQNFIQG